MQLFFGTRFFSGNPQFPGDRFVRHRGNSSLALPNGYHGILKGIWMIYGIDIWYVYIYIIYIYTILYIQYIYIYIHIYRYINGYINDWDRSMEYHGSHLELREASIFPPSGVMGPNMAGKSLEPASREVPCHVWSPIFRSKVAPIVGPPSSLDLLLGFLRWYGLILVMSFVAGTTQATTVIQETKIGLWPNRCKKERFSNHSGSIYD